MRLDFFELDELFLLFRMPANGAAVVSCERSLGLRGITKRVRAGNLQIGWGEARAAGTSWGDLESLVKQR